MKNAGSSKHSTNGSLPLTYILGGILIAITYLAAGIATVLAAFHAFGGLAAVFTWAVLATLSNVYVTPSALSYLKSKRF